MAAETRPRWRKQPVERKALVSVRLEPECLKTVRAIADERRIPVGMFVREAIHAHVKRLRAPKKRRRADA